MMPRNAMQVVTLSLLCFTVYDPVQTRFTSPNMLCYMKTGGRPTLQHGLHLIKPKVLNKHLQVIVEVHGEECYTC